MNLQQLTQKVQQLAQQMQQTHDLAKKISELPQQSNLDANSLVHVSRNGVSESLELQKLIDAIISYNYDRLVSVGLITITGNILNIPALVEWVISQVNYIKTSETNIEIPLSATGNIRIDFILGNEVGEVYRYAGPENEGVAIRQSVPPGNILITELTVTDSGISEPSEPITGSDYITKSSRGDNFIGATGENVLLPEPSDKVGFRLISPGLISIDGILYGGFGSAITIGDLVPITNVTGSSIPLNHGSSFITDNYVLPNKKVAIFRYEGSGVYRLVASYGTTPNLQSVTDVNNSTTRSITSKNADNTKRATISQYEVGVYDDNSQQSVSFQPNQITIVDTGKNAILRKNSAQTDATVIAQMPKTSGTLALLADISNIDFQVNQANATLSLIDATGQVISSIDLGFLNNEGTTFFYNDVTEKLELQNDAGEVLSELPISSFVSNFAKSLSLNDSILSLRDNAGNILNSVDIKISNVSGLSIELDNKVDKIAGYSLTKNDLTDALKSAYDNTVISSSANTIAISNHLGNTSNPHAVTKNQVGLGNADNTSDLNKPISTATQTALNLKANDTDVLHKTGNETKTGDLNLTGNFKAINIEASASISSFKNGDTTKSVGLNWSADDIIRGALIGSNIFESYKITGFNGILLKDYVLFGELSSEFAGTVSASNATGSNHLIPLGQAENRYSLKNDTQVFTDVNQADIELTAENTYVFSSNSVGFLAKLPKSSDHKGKMVRLVSTVANPIQAGSIDGVTNDFRYRTNTANGTSTYYSFSVVSNGSQWVITDFINY